MIAAWMLYCVGIGLAFVVAGHALERGLHLAGRPTRWAWAVALAGSFLVPAAAWLLPDAFRAVSVPAPGPIAYQPVADVGSNTVEQAAVAAPPSVAPRALAPGDLDRPLAWSWAVASGALLAVLTIAALRLAVLRRRWRATVVHGRRVLVSDDVGPAVAGVWGPRIVIPGWALQLAERQRELMLAHEEEHVRAGDPRLLAWGVLALLLAPWNPALWWQIRRLRLAVEMDCDARVLARGGPAPEYGELLLQVGGRRAQLALGAPALGEPRSFLERRIRRLATAPPRWRWLGAVAAVLLAGGAVAGACEAPRPVASETPQIRPEREIVVRRSGVSSEDVRPLLVRYFGPDPARLADSAVVAWFVLDHPGAVVANGTFPRTPGETGLDAWAAARRIPGYDTLRVGAVLLHAPQTLPPTVVVRLRDSNDARRDLSALREHPEMVVLPWIREGIARHYPSLFRERSGPPVELWFLADARKQVFRTVQRPGQDVIRVGIEEIHAVFPALDESNVYGWRLVQGRGLGRLVRENVRVIWVELREGKSISPG